MRSLLFVLILLGGCSGAIKVVPSNPVGQVSKNYNQQSSTPNKPQVKETTPSDIWMVLWLGSVTLAGFATYRTFKKK